MRKVRLWVCYKCSAVYRRYTSEKTRRCYCGAMTAKARKWPSADFYKHRDRVAKRAAEQRQLVAKKYSRVWNSEGHILQVSSASCKIWRELEKLQHRDAVSRWAEKLLISLRVDLGKFGSMGTPKVVYASNYGSTGIYRRSLLQGLWQIELDPLRQVSEIKQTLLHEILHWIDDQASSSCRFGHLPTDHYEFEPRLADLKKRLGVRLS